jgi:hypothetical protein
LTRNCEGTEQLRHHNNGDFKKRGAKRCFYRRKTKALMKSE